MARSKVKSRSHHGDAHLQPPTNVPTKYQLPTPNGFQDRTLTRFVGQGHYSKVKSRSHHDDKHLYPLTMSIPSINFLRLTVSEI